MFIPATAKQIKKYIFIFLYCLIFFILYLLWSYWSKSCKIVFLHGIWMILNTLLYLTVTQFLE